MTDDFEMPTPAATATSLPVTAASTTTPNGALAAPAAPAADVPAATVEPVAEQGGPPGPEPTRFGDWERKGRCIDF